jgi:nucleoside 2-deoxyribosyltransferase
MRVYLAGPIANMSDAETHDWREMVARVLGDIGIEAVDPAKVRDFRGVPYPGDLAVVEPDKADIDSCDVLLAYTHVPSVGTSMEILYAWERAKFVVIVHPDPAHASPWLHYHAHVLEGWFDTAILAIADYREDPTAWTAHDIDKAKALGRPIGQTAIPSEQISEIEVALRGQELGQDARVNS